MLFQIALTVVSWLNKTEVELLEILVLVSHYHRS